MQNVSVVSTCIFNLCSVTRLLKQGFELYGNKTALTLTKDKHVLKFDITVDTPKGMIFAMYFKPQKQEMAGTVTDSKPMKLTIQQAHDRLGHCSEDATRKTAKYRGWEITKGSMKPCQSCAAGKAKQKNVPKESDEKLKAVEGKNRIYLDIATIKKKEGMPKPTRPHWLIQVDERSQMKFSEFLKRKNDMPEIVCEQWQRWKTRDLLPYYCRLDNAGENKLLMKRATSKDWKFSTDFEFTARNTPQQNSKAEVAFATIANRGRALMNRANIPEEIRYRVYSEAFQTATLLDNLIPIEVDGKLESKYKHW